MPKTVDIRIYKIGQSQPDTLEIEDWLQDLGVSEEFELPEPPELPPSELVPALAAKRCYMSFEPGMNKNVTQVRKDYDEYFANILKSGHGSVLEHTYYSFAIEGVSRVFTAEMNRHRAGWAISEASMRFIRFDECIPYWLPTSIMEAPDDDESLSAKKRRTRAIFDRVFKFVEENYAELMQIWDMDETDKNFDYKKKVTSCLRRIVPLGVATGGVWTGNIRALRHVLTMRCAPSAEEEIMHVFSMIAARMAEDHPQVFGDFELDDAGFWRPKYWKV